MKYEVKHARFSWALVMRSCDIKKAGHSSDTGDWLVFAAMLGQVSGYDHPTTIRDFENSVKYFLPPNAGYIRMYFEKRMR